MKMEIIAMAVILVKKVTMGIFVATDWCLMTEAIKQVLLRQKKKGGFHLILIIASKGKLKENQGSDFS